MSTSVYLLIAIAATARAAILPSGSLFVSQLFNASATETQHILKHFAFKDVGRENVQFLLYSKHQENPIELNSQNQYLVDLSKPTKIIVHGWLASGRIEWVSTIAKNYHKKGQFNVIAVDWSKDANQSYYQSAQCVSSVGKIIGSFILNLINHSHHLKKIHLVGHSFGAQASGFAGQYVKEHSQNHEKVDRITGLDPANVLFEFPISKPDNQKLSKDDADFVDVIHTDAGLVGIQEPAGTVDFYPNAGGPLQPECNGDNSISNMVCSHEIAHEYFSKAILEPDLYQGVSCWNSIIYSWGLCNGNEKISMGESVKRHATGKFFLKTVA